MLVCVGSRLAMIVSADQVQIGLARMPARALADVISALSRAPDVRDVRTVTA
jgi:hypothetical protein